MDIRLDEGIQNTLNIFSEHLSDYNDLNKIRVYMEILRHIEFEEEYDEWFIENVLNEN